MEQRFYGLTVPPLTEPSVSKHSKEYKAVTLTSSWA